MKRQENRAVLAWRGAASAGLDSSADRAYMKAPVPRPTLQLVDKVSRSCGHTPGKVAGQRATVKAEMNGFTPGLDLRPLSRWMGGQGGQSLKVLGRSLSDFEVFSFSKLNNQNKFLIVSRSLCKLFQFPAPCRSICYAAGSFLPLTEDSEEAPWSSNICSISAEACLNPF